MEKLQEKLEKARMLHKSGLNCSQCAAIVFSEITGLDDKTAAAIMSGFGGGVGGQGDVCGAISGIVMVEGMRREPGKETKMTTYNNVKDISARFTEENGSIVCRELRSKDGMAANGNKINRKPCMQYIEDAIRIYYGYLNDQE